ncbi:unnamed protein product [Brachionus calyciflorus]|uniref:Uncharacterized protein n=1 Tax=Brachionus calyciflorus TaxID=104777 RepID=A0A814GHM0_9BILA|nr:unnamed protein product [Brachionus calyciflorus]
MAENSGLSYKELATIHYKVRTSNYMNQKQMFLNNEISIETYIKYTIKVFDFAKLERKAKMAEDIDDDKDSADSLSDYEESDDDESDVDQEIN